MNRLTQKLVYSSPSVEDIAFESEQCLTNVSQTGNRNLPTMGVGSRNDDFDDDF